MTTPKAANALTDGDTNESLARVFFHEAMREIEGDDPPTIGTNPEVVFDEFVEIARRHGYEVVLTKVEA